MKLFKHLREEALKKVSVGKVFEPTSSDDNKKDPAFSKKGKVATGDEGQLKYGSKNNDVHVTEEVDLDQKYSDWQDEVKQRNPQHAAKIKFKTNPDQRDTISAEHGDRSFGTFNTKTGEAIHLGEATEGNKFESAYDVVAHLAKAGYHGIQAKDVELYQGGRATARHRGSSASQHYGKCFSVNAAGDVKVHGDETSAIKAIKEEVELDEDNSPAKKVATFSTKDYNGNEYNFNVFNKNGKHSYQIKGKHANFHPNVAFRSGAGGDRDTEAHARKVVDLVAAGKHKEALAHLNAYGKTNWSQSVKEEVELEEAVKLGSKVSIHAPGKSYHGKTGIVGEVRHGLYKGAPKTYTVDYDYDDDTGHSKSIQLDKKNIKLQKEEVELEEDYGYENRDAKDAHLTYTQYMRKYYPSKYKGMWESEDCRVCGQTPCNCTFINEDYKEKNYEYKNKDGKTATLSCATYSDGDAEHFVHIKGQRATRHSTKEKAHQSLRVRGYEPTGKVEEE